MTELRKGQIVTGVVVEQRHFGVFVDIGAGEPAVTLITMLEDEPRSRQPVMPKIGSRVDAVLLGFSGPTRQPRLSMRPSDIAKARGESSAGS